MCYKYLPSLVIESIIVMHRFIVIGSIVFVSRFAFAVLSRPSGINACLISAGNMENTFKQENVVLVSTQKCKKKKSLYNIKHYYVYKKALRMKRQYNIIKNS